MPPHHIQNFASQSGLRPPHLSLRFTGQSILLRKTVYCQNFATQNRLQRQRSSLFLTARFSSGCILCGSLFRTLLRKVATPPHHGQSILLRKTVFDRPVFFGVHTLRFTGQSILLCKTVYCQNFATQNRLFRTLLRKAVFDRRIYLCGS